MILFFGTFIHIFVGAVAVTPLLFTSSWFGTQNDITVAKAATIDIKDCAKTQDFTPSFITNGLSLLSPYNLMDAESTRLKNLNIKYVIGEENKFLQFIFPLDTPGLIKLQPIYPNDTEVMKVVLAVFNRVSMPSFPKINIMVIINRTQDYNNLAVNNYVNFIRIINAQNWTNVNILQYISVENIIYNLRQQNFFVIISLLNDPEVNSQLIQKIYLAHLMIWKYRWIIVDLLGGTNVLNQTQFRQGSLSNNVTIITFSQDNLDGRAILLRSAFNVTIDISCPSPPTNTLTTSGTFAGGTRETFKFAIYQNPGNRSVFMGFADYSRITGDVTLPSSLKSINFDLDYATSSNLISSTGFIIGFVEYPPFSMRNGTNYSGFTIELLTNILSDFNVIPTIIPLPIDQVGSYNALNRSFSDLLGIVQNGTIDTISLPVILTVERLNAFDFTTYVLPGYIAGIYLNPSMLGINSLQNYAKSFDFTVWACLLASAVAIAIALTITDCFFPDKYARYKILMSTFFSISSLTHGAYFDPPRRAGGIIVMSFWWLFCLFAVIIWATNYTALLAKQNREQKLTSFNSMIRQNVFKYITVNDNVVFRYLTSNPNQYPRTFYRIMNEETVNGTVANVSTAIKLVQEGNTIFVYDDKTLSYYSLLKCLTMFAKYVSFDYGFPLAKYSAKTLALNTKLAERIASGYASNLVRKYWPSHNPNCASRDFMENIANSLQPLVPNTFIGSLNLNAMIAVFVIVIVGGVLCLILAVIEKLIRYLILRSQRQQDQYRYETTVEQLTQF